ncbi:MAG: Stk1 family PASTA domain-containing Ser/Thr kinase [Coriobacteriia bacterium]
MEDLVFGRRYRATEKIGTGGMADVYKAVDDVLGRTVAVKVLHAHYATDAAFVARFRQEAQAAANLSHPNIVNIYDWGRDDEVYYIVMEYVRGTDLKELVTEKGPLDAFKAADYCAQVCSALSVAHGYDIIHRDIKPHNIVLTPDGQIKVMDFGIARAGNTTMTQTGSVLGTAHYVSPEQAQGRTLGPQSDLYSLGVVLYELVTGQVPFDGDSPVAVALKQVNDEPVPPREIDPDIPPSVEAVIARAMQKSPADRYSSAEEMRRDLLRVASGRMVEAPMAAAGAAGQTTVMPAVGDRGDQVGSTRVRPIPRRRNPWPWVALVALLLLIGLAAAWQFDLFESTPMVIVPEITGSTLAEAQEALTAVGLKVGEVERVFSEEASGTVLTQSPEPGTEVALDSIVDISVSQGQEMFQIPDLVGMSEAEAIAKVRSAGFELATITREFNKEIEEGQVFQQDPPAGGSAIAGSEITLVVSKGTQLVKVPSVANKKLGDARTELEQAGFVVKVVEKSSDEVATGVVISQSPEPGVSIEAGSQVTITASTGPDLVTVPDVTKKPESQARDILTARGFDVLVNYQVSPEENDGLVLAQDPVPNFEARAGSAVTIWVGQTPEP